MSTTETNIPVTLIRGFLDAGKTTQINKWLRDGTWDSAGQILLLSCEEGESAYEEQLLENKKITFLNIDDEDLLCQEYLQTLSDTHSPAHIVIECNAMWKMIEFELPRNWKVTQRIAILSTPTLELYLNNMRALMGPMLSRCDRIYINRCSDISQLMPIKPKLRPLLEDPAKVAIESCGQLLGLDDVKDHLPYSLEEEVITITPDTYVFWYYDCRDHQTRYEGRLISLSGSIKKSPILPPDEFALGKIAITCCEADMSFLGYLAHYDATEKIGQYSYVQVTAIVQYRYTANYQAVMPYLEILQMEPCHIDDPIASY